MDDNLLIPFIKGPGNSPADDHPDDDPPGNGPPPDDMRTPGASTAANPVGVIKKLSYTHEAMVDLIVAHPEYSQRQLAEHFGYTQSWISQVIASDAFQSALAKRKDEIVDPVMKNTIEENFKGMVRRSHEILMEKLNRSAAQIPDNLALRTYELGMRGAGYGAKSPEPKVQVNVVSHLETLGSNLELLLRRKRQIVEAENVSDDPTSPQAEER